MRAELLVIDKTRVHGIILFATHSERCWYIGMRIQEQVQWLKDHPDRWKYIQDIPGKADPLVETETEVRNVELKALEKNTDDLAVLRELEPAKLGVESAKISASQPMTATVPSGPTQTELPPHAKVATSETKGPKTETAPLEATGRKRGRSGGRRTSKARRKLSPELMRVVLDSLTECPILWRAARKAGIHRKTLQYWLKCSKAGHDGYDLVWQDELCRFHHHCAAAIQEPYDELLLIAYKMAMGVKYPGSEVYMTPPNGRMIRFLLELLLPEKYGKRRKVKATPRSHLLVVGGPAKKKREYNTAASVRARQWRSLSREIQKATD